MSVYDFKMNDIDSNLVSLADYKGKVLLIVNTASQCGFTPQYQGLEKLYQELGPEGLVILGFPCDQFGNQEPGDSDEIKNFCELNYGVTFPLFEKIEVNGDHAHPLFKFLKEAQPGLLGNEIKWNFTKFLVNRQGDVVNRFASTTEPEKLKPVIKALLEEPYTEPVMQKAENETENISHRLVERPAFRVMGKSIRVICDNGKNLKEIAEFWKRSNAEGITQALLSYTDTGNLLGVSMAADPVTQEMTYMIAVEPRSGDQTTRLEFYEFPAATWAVFPSVGPMPAASWTAFSSVGPMPGTFQDVWHSIFQERLPAAGLEPLDIPTLEVYPPGDVTAADYQCEIWVPVVKK